jgi:hypothetical protein
MTESTLSIAYADLTAEVGAFLGYGRTSGNWTSDQTTEIDKIVQSGLRQFYFPPMLQGQSNTHEWQFLKPTTSLVAWPEVTGTMVGVPVFVTVSTTTASTASFYPTMIGKAFVFDTSGTSYVIAGYTSSTIITLTGDASGELSGDTFTIASNGDYRLPDDFGGLEGKLTYEPNEGYYPITVTSEMAIRNLRQRVYSTGNTSGRPYSAAVRPLITDGTDGQRFEIMLWPAVNAAYTLSYRYRVLMNLLDATNKYPYGGMVHGETIIESCLSIAEQRSDDEIGLHYQKFMERLAASVGFDSKGTRPDNLGYNSDNSGVSTTSLDWRNGNVTYNGTLYDGSN